MRIAVCLHLYYTWQFDEIVKYLENLDSFDLFITLPRENKFFLPKIRHRFPKCNVIVTDNVGFDIYPFIEFINRINLNDYDVIFKIHSKKDIPIEQTIPNGVNVSASRWRDLMYRAILGSKARTSWIVHMFESQPQIGMICSEECLLRGVHQVQPDIDINKVSDLMKDCGLNVSRWEFECGSIFAVRSTLLAPIKRKAFTKEDFPPYYPKDWNGLPYLLERVFGCMISAQGCSICGISSETVVSNEEYMK